MARHYRSLQQLFRWLHEVEKGISSNPFDRLKPPQVPEQPVPLVSDDAINALLATCKGPSFEDRRDHAYIRLLVDSGPRAGEITPLDVDDLDFNTDVADVMGKGRRARAIPFGNKTGNALRRYIRARARHPQAAGTKRLWIGKQGPMTESGMAQILRRRAKQAGIMHIYPHLMRHLFSHNYLAAGGREQDLMRLNGWKSIQMVGRYGKSAADERARAAYRQAAVGDTKY
ncbi:tyrosine-type recombinase/integrase [Saccharopolyspora taberi]|uniref:Tyrosine recombinase XerC n=1 Tax=Saccharopolyspora taberi TaxID=60895 RepID=A0ABN3VMX5_9PSEU